MIRFTVFLALFLPILSCGRYDNSPSYSQVLDFKHVKKAVLRDDGLYNVICGDGSIETGISLQQIERDEVCDTPPAPSDPGDPVAEFLHKCVNPPTLEWRSALKLLSEKTNRQDCSGIYAALKQKQKLQFFAYPPLSPTPLLTTEPLSYFPQLEDLTVVSQGILDIDPLAKLGITQLRIAHNRIGKLDRLYGQNKLRYLDVSHNEIDDPLIAAKFPHAAVAAVDNPKLQLYETKPWSAFGFYSGHVAFLQNESDTLDLDEMLSKHEKQMATVADLTAFVGSDFEQTYGDQGTLAADIKGRKVALEKDLREAIKRGKLKEPQATDRTLAARWWLDQVQALSLPTDVYAQVNTKFRQYCDAKIVELASHPEFARLSTNGYKTRPSPQQFCELYYAEQNYFQGDDCSDGGNFFRCLWKEGVMKSGSFAGEAGQALRSQVSAVLDDPNKLEIFRLLLLSDSQVSEPYINISSTGSTARIIKDQIYSRRSYFYNGLLNGRPSIGSEALCSQAVETSFAFICGGFSRLWNSEFPGNFLRTFEFVQAIPPGADSEQLRSLIQLINFFGMRPLVRQPQMSRADLLFHQFTDSNTITGAESVPAETDRGLVDLVLTLIDKTLHALSQQDGETISRGTRVINELENQLRWHREEKFRLTVVATDALSDQIRSANRMPSVQAFSKIQFSMRREGDITRIGLSFGSEASTSFVGCFNNLTLSTVKCLSDGSFLEFQDLSMTSTGRLKLSAQLNDPVAVGWPQKSKSSASPDFFSEILLNDLTGSTFNLDLQLYQYKSVLPVQIGKTRIVKDGIVNFEGVISTQSSP